MKPSPVLPGIDNLLAGGAPMIVDYLRARRVGLLTNHTGRTLQGKPTIDALRDLGVNVVALFSPEHGPAGNREGDIESGRSADGLPVHSLYGETRRPTPAMLEGIDAIVCDVQDVGARFYTYSTTLAYILEAGAVQGCGVTVLDRPNPLGGLTVEGPALHDESRSFVGYLHVPVRHGLTLGELAGYHCADAGLDVDLQVAPVLGWKRAMTWPATGLTWPVPSPNLPDYEAAAWYPGLCLLEFSGVSVGRGTSAPFRTLGAPWMDGVRLKEALLILEAWSKLDVECEALQFTPDRPLYAGELCRGLHLGIRHGVPAETVELGLVLLHALHRTHPVEFGVNKIQAALPLLGSPPVAAALADGNIDGACALAREAVDAFKAQRRPHLLYD